MFKDFLKIIPKTSETRALFFVVSDIVLISLSVYLAFVLRFDGKIPSQYLVKLDSFSCVETVIILSLVFYLFAFYFFKLYFFSWSYVSVQELISLIKAASLGFLFLIISFYIFKKELIFQSFPRSTFFISYFLILLFCGGLRFSKRIYLQFFQERAQKEKNPTLIIGAGDAGEQILRSILSSPLSPYSPVGFIDDDKLKQGSLIHGIKVLGGIEEIPQVVSNYKVEEMIIALPSAGRGLIKKAVEIGRQAGLKKIKIIPSITEIINGQVSVKNIREVQVEDLLGREQVSLDTALIRNFVQDKRVLVTGAAGSIGSELCQQIAKFNPSLLLILDQDETGIFNISQKLKNKFPQLNFVWKIGSICNKLKIDRIFEEFKPEIVFHAAAYKHVPLMEEEAEEAVMNNIFGTKILAEKALNQGIEKFIFISTDKAINPTSVMGATKRAGEMICQTLNKKSPTNFISLRFGNVLNSRGSVIPIFRKQIKKGGPVEITHPEMKRYFMITSEACLLVMQAGAMGQGGEVFVLDMGKPVKIVDLAGEMIRLSGFEPDKDIPVVFTGIRQGEKLFEEILTVEEGTTATQNQKIFMAKLSDIDEKKLNFNLEKLKIAVDNSDKQEIKAILKDLIPSYGPHIFQT
ncbi:polysaccharide biosynthesis protein [Candidatus Parcubacteria bacterium]|nr:polysaccharide biosynthesis protein [Candidatus Parcubacteria bacterium]